MRAHSLSFPRDDLKERRIGTCEEAMNARDGKWLEDAGLVLVRRRRGSAKGVMFTNIEDEPGHANLVVWVVFEKYRRVVPGASMNGVYGKIQREGEVVRLVVHRLTDFSGELAGVGSREGGLPLPHGRGDEFHLGSPQARLFGRVHAADQR